MKSMPFGDLVSAGAGHPQQSPCWREVLLEELAGAADSGPLRPLLKWLTVGFQLRRGTGEENQKSSRSYPPPPAPPPLVCSTTPNLLHQWCNWNTDDWAENEEH